MPEHGIPQARLGVVVVTFNAADVILDCLESLLATRDVVLDIVVVDNASTDGTVSCLQDWAAGRKLYLPSEDLPFVMAPVPKPVALLPPNSGPAQPENHRITLMETGLNAGFAAGVNAGLAYLAQYPALDRFWVLNPDCVVPAQTPLAFATEPAPADGFALMGGRILYLEGPAPDGTGKIQIDGGRINWMTGVTGNINVYLPHPGTAAPADHELAFISGASMVASRAFYETAGPLPEDYFLYYEEVDWALRRGALPLAYCAGATVYHRAGSAIGSHRPGRPASAFSLFFKYRARLRFLRRFHPWGLPGGYAYSLAKAVQLLLKAYPREAWVILVASLDGPPPAEISSCLSPAARPGAFASFSRQIQRQRPRARDPMAR